MFVKFRRYAGALIVSAALSAFAGGARRRSNFVCVFARSGLRFDHLGDRERESQRPQRFDQDRASFVNSCVDASGDDRAIQPRSQGVLAIPQMRESGIPVRIVSTLLRYHPDGHSADLWVKKDSPYKTIKDLKGKTIAVTTTEAQNVISIRWVISEQFGMNADTVGGDFKWVEMPHSQFEAALQSGRVDAVAFSNVSSYTLTKGGAYRSVLHGSKELEQMLGGPMPSLFMLGYDPDLNKHPDTYVAALKLLKTSAAYVLTHQDEVFSAVAPKFKMTKQDVQTWFTTFAQMPLALGPTDKMVMVKAWALGAKYGMLKKAPTSADELVWAKAVTQ